MEETSGLKKIVEETSGLKERGRKFPPWKVK